MIGTIRTLKIPRNPFILFSPFLILYILIVLVLNSDSVYGDEFRYLEYAQNLLHGFYSGPDPLLANGPGYPIFLMPFLALHLPFLVIKLANPVFFYLSIIFLFKVLRQIVSFQMTFLVCLFWAFYINAYENFPLMVTETFTVFLVSAFMFCVMKAFQTEKLGKYIILSGLLFGYIVLTKLIFGHVMFLMLICCFVFWLIKRKNSNIKKTLVILIVALIATAPYLIYTYHLTGRPFYWSTYAGNNLYWMSSPYNDEYGSWQEYPENVADINFPPGNNEPDAPGGILNFKNRNYHSRGYDELLISRHKKDFEKIRQFKTNMGQDDEFKRIALQNIKEHPLKYIQNCISNVGRMFFNIPYSYKNQSPGTFLRLPFTGILAVLMLFCLIPTFINWKKIDFPIRLLLIISLIYLGGSALASAETRMLTIIVPVLLVWVSFILNKTIKLKLRF